MKEQGKANRKGSMKPDTAYQIDLKWSINIAFRTMYCSQTNTQPMAMEEALTLGTGTREPGREQTRKNDQRRLHPSPYLGLADHAGQNQAWQTRRRWKLWKRPAAQQTPANEAHEQTTTGVSHPAPMPT
jgi:hypothetical protein